MSQTKAPTAEDEYCGYAPHVNVRDVFLVAWSSVFLIFTTTVYFWSTLECFANNQIEKNNDTGTPSSSSPNPNIKHNRSTSRSYSSNVQKKNKENEKKWMWRMGYLTCTVIYLREFFYVIAWYFWIITYSYSLKSGCYLFYVVSHSCWVASGFLLYSFFIYRLYSVYNANGTGSMFAIKMYFYVILVFLNLCYALSLSVTAYAWRWYDSFLYTTSNATSLCLEIIMTIMVSTLFFKPLLKVSMMSMKHHDNYDYHKDKTLMLLSKLSILSCISMSTTTLFRAITIASFTLCPCECWITFIYYSAWSLDSFVNIFCVLCSFQYGHKYYEKYCSALQNYVLLKCIGIMDKKVTTVQKTIIVANTSNSTADTANELTRISPDTVLS